MKRQATIKRQTSETQIQVELDLDGSGQYHVNTPIPFLTHMLEQLARHGMLDLKIDASGDTQIDGHHTTEDIGFTFGQAVAKALGDRSNIQRFGSVTVPMDEACVTCALDLSGRSFLVWRVSLPKAKVGDFDSELAEVFFEGTVRGMGCNLHVHLIEGNIIHHIIEVAFKAFARALREAVAYDKNITGVPSTKGTLTD